MCEEVILNQTKSAAVVVCSGKCTRKHNESTGAVAASEQARALGRMVRRWMALSASLANRAVPNAVGHGKRQEEAAGVGRKTW